MGSDDEYLLAKLADMTAAEVPLPEGLRAAAAEAIGRRLARQLHQVADQLQKGSSLSEALQSARPGMPTYLIRAVESGLQHGQLASTLVELIECNDARRRNRHEFLAAVFYPVVLVFIMLAVMLLVLIAVIPPMREIIVSFQFETPYSTRIMFWIFDDGWQWGLSGLLIAMVAIGLLRIVMGQGRWWWFVGSFPVIGPLIRWMGVAEFTRFWRVLVGLQIPTSEGLRLTAGSLRDPNLAEMARLMASAVEGGSPVTRVLETTGRAPASLLPMLAWGESENRLHDALSLATEVFEGRIQLRTRLLAAVLPPCVFVLVAAGTAAIALGLIQPLITLLQNFY